MLAVLLHAPGLAAPIASRMLDIHLLEVTISTCAWKFSLEPNSRTEGVGKLISHLEKSYCSAGSHILAACNNCTTNAKCIMQVAILHSANCCHVASDFTAEVAGSVFAQIPKIAESRLVKVLSGFIRCGDAAPSPGGLSASGLSEALDPPPAAPATTGAASGYGDAATPATGMPFHRYALHQAASSGLVWCNTQLCPFVPSESGT